MFKSLLKTLAVIVGTLVGVVILLTLAFNYWLSPNKFKPEIEQWFLQQTGRELIIEGDLGVTLIPWLGVDTGALKLKNPTGFDQPFLVEIERSELHLKLWPLFRKQLELSRIEVQGFKINLSTNRLGEQNWLIRQPVPVKTALAETAPSSPSAWKDNLNIAGLAFTEGEITWRDVPNNRHIKFTDITLNTGSWRPGGKTPLDLSANWLDVAIGKPLPVVLKTEFQVDADFKKYQLAPFSLTGQGLHSQPYALRSQIFYDQPAQQLTLAELFIEFAPFQAAGEIQINQLTSKPTAIGKLNTPTFNLAQALTAWGAVPLLAASDSLSRFSGRLEFTADSQRLDITNLSVSLDDSQLIGQVAVDNYQQPVYTFSAEIDQLDLARYLPAEVKTEANLPAVFKTGVWTGVGRGHLQPVAEASTTNRWLNVALDGLIKVNQFRFDKIKGEGLTVQLDGKNGLYQTTHSFNRFYQGQVAGQAEFDLRQSDVSIRLQETLHNVQLRPLLLDGSGQATIDGLLSATAEIETQGRNNQQYLANMNGKFSFALQDSVIKGINFQQMIDHVKSLIDGKTAPATHPDQQTVFKTITGSGPITQGVWHNPDLAADSSRMKISGQGLVDLIRQRLNYQLEGRLQVKSGDSEDVRKASRIPLLLNLEGPWNKPELKMDMAAMALSAKQGELKQKADKLLDKLEQKIGPGASELLKKLF